MSAEHKVISCNDCGARFKVPATFSGKKVRCSKCGGVIDLAESSSPAAPAPAAAKPAAAAPDKPARTSRAKAGGDEKPARRARASAKGAGDDGDAKPARRSRTAAKAGDDDGGKPARKTRGGATRGRGGRSRGGDDGDGDGGGGGRARRGGGGGRGRRAAEASETKSGPPIVLIAGIGVVVIAAAVILFMTMGGDDGDTQETGKTASAETKKDGDAATNLETKGAEDSSGEEGAGEETTPDETPELVDNGPWDPVYHMDSDYENTVVQMKPVPFLDDCPEDVKTKVEELSAIAGDSSKTREQRSAVTDLKAIEKHGVTGLVNAFNGLDMANESDRIIGSLLDAAIYDVFKKGNERWFVNEPEDATVKGGIETYNQKAVNLWIKFYCANVRNDAFWILIEQRRKDLEEAEKRQLEEGRDGE
ncbi:MAG: hypothetical protein RL885_08220 [Planctomycetota bacterium]